VAYDLGHFDLALDAFGAASRAYDDPIDRARMCSRRVAVQHKRGALVQAATWATKGLRLLEGSTDPRALALRAQLALDQAATVHFQGRNRDSVRWAERAATEAMATSDQRLLATAHLHLEMAHSMLGDGQAAGHGEKAVALFEAVGDRRGLGNALINSGLTAYDEGRWADARSLYGRAAEVAASTGDVTQVATTELNTAFLLAELGETDEAAALCASAGRAFRASGNELTLGYVDWLTSRLALWAGDVATAKELLGAARRRFEGVGSRQMVLDCDVAAVELLLVAGDDARAAAEAGRLVVEIDAFGPAELLPITVRRLRSHACMRTGDPEGALASAEQAVELARDHGARMELALSLDALAHAEQALGRSPTPAVLAERDQLLAGLGVQQTILPVA
jgi:tetratricopeptide (TPR) repeat protein